LRQALTQIRLPDVNDHQTHAAGQGKARNRSRESHSHSNRATDSEFAYLSCPVCSLPVEFRSAASPA
jgi:hypothetical protein